MPKRVLLIDGDQFVFKAAVAVEEEVRWDDQNHVLFSNYNKAWENLTGMLDRIFERFETNEHALCFSTDSSKPNFRYGVWADYKGKRSPRKPLCYARMIESVQSEYNCVSMPGLEADDVMGILATKPGKTQRVIVSQDKDMRTIPTHVWNGKDDYHVTPEEADRFHMYQTLIGDTSDGYPGCPGVGDVSATAFLDAPYILEAYAHILKSGPRKGLEEIRWAQVPTDNMWEGVVSHYLKAGLTEADALVQARLARILRWSDWNGETKEPILWSPK